MPTVYGMQRIQRLLLLSFSVLVLIVVLAACGVNPGTTGSGGQPPTPTPAPAPGKGYGTSVGCPSNTVVSSAPTKANVTVQMSNLNVPITAHVGDVIEVRLPFGHKWGGPIASQDGLDLQQPAGYAWKTDNVCIWRFVAKGTGTSQLLFHSQALCKPGEMCPLYITSIPFTVTVK